ncbi:imidazole glycerol phosphate synthase subunit HisH [Ventosimonas gracilis]|uniref:Imidazole glycerol phosphate synthase subunit HisH n=1 Tax=Ventosimonas gracilis TaxID=1680762 RepID=A0A139SQY2_9GAMM|nr:imidazole glycerol phosphate synthase subunit HisH [Ventosimonas gracilis]KXU36958.1 imidazole glycerol phosphate synthase subunit HisH [Ventosimonas gracilis]
MTEVVVIDYGMGNLHSVGKALEAVGARSVHISSEPSIIRAAPRLIFPGVGAIKDCMAQLKQLGLCQLIKEVSHDRPFLGICLGMQALMDKSEENGGVDGLGIFPGTARYFGSELFEDGERLKVPHMGWNQVKQTYPHPLWHKTEDNGRFYFVHSYYIEAQNPAHISGQTHYGKTFASALAEGSRFAVQFHPEKSHFLGLQLLHNFIRWNGQA